MSNSEWGPWIIHDQSGCPVPTGAIAEVDITGPIEYVGRYVVCVNVDWHDWDKMDSISRSFYIEMGIVIGVIKYRIKKPKGMQILIDVMNDIREPVFA